MDAITLDDTRIFPEHAQSGEPVEFIGRPHPLDALALELGAIGYEILTSLGRCYRRSYIKNGRPRGKAVS